MKTTDTEHAAQAHEKTYAKSRRWPHVLLRGLLFFAGLVGFWAIGGAEYGLTAGEALLMSALYAALWGTGRLLARPMR